MGFESFNNNTAQEKPELQNKPERRRNLVEITKRLFGIDVSVIINPEEPTSFTFDQETNRADIKTSPEAIRRTLTGIRDYAASSPAIQEDINRRKEQLKKKIAMAREHDMRKAQRRYGYDPTIGRGFEPVMNTSETREAKSPASADKGRGNPDIIDAEYTIPGEASDKKSTTAENIPEAKVVEDFLEKIAELDASRAVSDAELLKGGARYKYRNNGKDRYLDVTGDQIEKAREEMEENLASLEQGWKGNWTKGERPEGYKDTSERYKKLKSVGFSTANTLGADFVKNYNSLIVKAKEGGLTDEEVKKLLEHNTTFHAAMDTFKETL